MKTEQQAFLEDLDIKNDDVLEAPLTEETPKEPEKETEEESDMKAKNRRERRLLEKNQRLREEAIGYAARLQALTESQETRKAEPADYLKRIEKIYGNATPEAQEATELLKESLEAVKLAAREEAIAEYDKRRTSESEEVKKEEANLDDILESVEDEHGIDMSDDDERKGFLAYLEKLSPKDRDGNIIEYADKDATAELYLARKEKSNDRAKELANRSMTRSGASAPSKIEDDATVKYLKEHGII